MKRRMDYHQGQFVTRMVETPEVTKRLELFVRKQGENNYGKENQKKYYMDEIMKDEEKSIFDDDDEIDTFADAGLDYDELEFMDPDERREVLEDAGLDPDEFDF